MAGAKKTNGKKQIEEARKSLKGLAKETTGYAPQKVGAEAMPKKKGR